MDAIMYGNPEKNKDSVLKIEAFSALDRMWKTPGAQIVTGRRSRVANRSPHGLLKLKNGRKAGESDGEDRHGDGCL
jgi:hypothetical protein